jgi:hypothetical protein
VFLSGVTDVSSLALSRLAAASGSSQLVNQRHIRKHQGHCLVDR